MKSIWTWFRSAPAREPQLKGAPAHARTKTYSAATGYVYLYVFKGYKESSAGVGREFVFEVTHDRKEYFHMTIRVSESALAGCAERIGRAVLSTERYALAKMTLFRVFDESGPEKLKETVTPDALEMEAHLRALKRA